MGLMGLIRLRLNPSEKGFNRGFPYVVGNPSKPIRINPRCGTERKGAVEWVVV